ncbi:phage tail spike protein [Heyndrickxia ginsengihumi]|uniref:phage tail spike protein n=1 Tax=Heyndrickxia ginsengihumi TaxID=363870 RepID=UPI003D193BAF
MYYILDPNLKICGILTLDGNQGCKFYDDLRSTKIADDQGKVWSDTLQLSVPYGYRETDMMTEGYHLLKQGKDGFFYCYRIFDWQDSAVGPVHVKAVQAMNLCMWDLNHRTLSNKTFTNITSTNAFNFVLQQSGWQIGNEDFSGSADSVEFTADQTAQSGLDSLISTFNVEIRARVEIYNGQVINKLIDIVQELGDSKGQRFEYSRNLQGVTRTGDDSSFYTKLHVFGADDSNGNKITIASVNGGKDYVVDDDANDLYNNGGTYLEGYIVNDNITNPNALLDWGESQLANYNHPKYTYEIDVSYLNGDAGLGDHVDVLDFEMQPPLTISARIIQVDESEANPSNCKYTIGEYVEITAVTPADIWELRAKASQAQQAAEKATAYKVEYFCPDGTDFADGESQKRIIIRVYLGTDNITNQIDPSKFIWQKIDSDGSHDTDWEDSHIGVGNVITVGSEVVGSTIRCQVDDGLTDPILFATEEDAAYFATLPMDNPSDDVNTHVAQYAQVDAENGYIYWSQEYFGSKKSSNGGWQSFSITRTTLDGEFVDQMWVIGGGHGSNFGIEHVGSDVYIWSAMINTSKSTLNGTTYWGVSRYKYVPNAILKYGSSGVQFYSFGATDYYRVNYDEKNSYVHLSKGEVTLYVCKKSDIQNNLFKPIYTMNGSDVGFDGSSQTFQSSCLDFPYVYFDAGDVNGLDERVMYCVDIRSKSLVYKIVYTFDKGTINQIGQYNEPECISYYYDENGKKWIIQGFAWGDEDIEDSERTNQLFRIEEHQRGDAS